MSTAPKRQGLRGDEADLFLAHHQPLLRHVARAVPDPPSAAEEACAFAWAELVRCQPDRERVVAWLAVVARREAIRVARRARREPPTTDSSAPPVWASGQDPTRIVD